MTRGRKGVHQLTALLVLAIVTAASGLPHWHSTPLIAPDDRDPLAEVAQSENPTLSSASEADLLECAACVLQRILTHAKTEGATAPPQPSLQTGVEPTPTPQVSTPPQRYADPRGPPWS
jgi:hypothetical protein